MVAFFYFYSSKVFKMNFTSPLITATDLHENFSNPNLILLDCTIDKVGQSLKNDILELIPSSHFFDLEEKFSDKSNPLPHTIVNEQVFTDEAQKLGINQDSIIVCYDRWGIYSSPRVWWMFKLMGHKNVYVLDGGLPEWKNNHFETTSTPIQHSIKGNFIADFQSSWLADKQIMLNSINDKSKTLIDARSEGRYKGTSPEPRKGLRSGHIPTSQNLFFEHVLDGTKYKSFRLVSNPKIKINNLHFYHKIILPKSLFEI